MLRATAKKVLPAARAARKMATATEASAGDAAQRVVKPLEIPAWGLVGLGAAAAGFFGKILHDDNLATRNELHETRQELRGDIQRIGEKLDAIAAKLPTAK